MELEKEIWQFLEREVPRPREARYLLAVSGGLDSMVLWDVWHRYGPPSYGVAHYHHGTRGSADLDLALVHRHGESLGVPVFTENRPLSTQSSEAALREDRYQFLENVRREQGYDLLVTAHHLNDQWETLLMRLIRGTGLEGMGGIYPRRGTLLRPLISVPRTALQDYAVTHQVAYQNDETNQSARYFRNRLRHSLTPVWNALAEPFGGERSLGRIDGLLGEIRDTQHWLEEEDERRLQSLAVRTPLWWRIQPDALRSMDPFWQKRLVRALGRKLEKKELGRADWERLRVALLENQNLDVTRSLRYRYSCGWGFFLFPELTPPPVWISASGGMECPALGMRVEGELSEGQVRFLQPGDRWKGRKMKERLRERRIPTLERQWIPVLASPSHSELQWHFPQASSQVRMSQLKFAFSFLESSPPQ